MALTRKLFIILLFIFGSTFSVDPLAHALAVQKRSEDIKREQKINTLTNVIFFGLVGCGLAILGGVYGAHIFANQSENSATPNTADRLKVESLSADYSTGQAMSQLIISGSPSPGQVGLLTSIFGPASMSDGTADRAAASAA